MFEPYFEARISDQQSDLASEQRLLLDKRLPHRHTRKVALASLEAEDRKLLHATTARKRLRKLVLHPGLSELIPLVDSTTDCLI